MTDQTSTTYNGRSAEQAVLAREWKRLGRAATIVALLTAPGLCLVLLSAGWNVAVAVIATILAVIAFRGLIDIIASRLLPRPTLQGADREELLDDAVARRRLWFWRGKWFRLLPTLLIIGGIIFVCALLFTRLLGYDSISKMWTTVQASLQQNPLVAVTTVMQLALFPLFFLFNIFILFGPLLIANLRQMKGYEPGDADWGVRVEDVRGQAEPKEEVQRVIALWQSGEEFRKAGGKPERGLLFIGAPGTGKTMLSKAIATNFNSPIVTMPGSGFAATFIGIDVMVVMMLIRKARKLARKWGGQCIIFIDEIDAVGLRRQALGNSMSAFSPSPLANGGAATSIDDVLYAGPGGALTASGDVIDQTRAWRERAFAARAEATRPNIPGIYRLLGDRINGVMFPGGMGGMGGGGQALNQLLVQMDGVDEPPMMRKFFSNRFNTWMDASYIVPRKIGKRPLRLPPPKPRSEQIYFIGATNVPIDRLDPALIRPGRMGRHIWFRTPTLDDRKDIFDLYLAKVAHEPDLDTEKRRTELARITNGYSPAMIEQVCSMALTLAHADGRMNFRWADIVEAMATIETGTAQGIEYVPEETRAVAIHEAGHVVASHVYRPNMVETRLTIRKRGGSLGHMMSTEKEERFSHWRHGFVGSLVVVLGAMAAEHVFYGENSEGVGGDLRSATSLAAVMVGMAGMGPEPIDLNGRKFLNDEDRREAEERYMKRFEAIGVQIMNRASGQVEGGDPIASILRDGAKMRAAARILGQAYITGMCLMRHNREKVLQVAAILIERREMHGDEVLEMLEAAQLEAPNIDINDESIWPRL